MSVATASSSREGKSRNNPLNLIFAFFTFYKLKSRRVRRTLVVGVASLSMAVLGLVTSSPASADAYGCSYYSWGNFCQNVFGGGLYVDRVVGNFVRAGNLCNWDISAEFFDSNNKWYYTNRSNTHYGCWPSNVDAIGIRSTMRTGYVCSTLRSNGSAVASRCASIHP